MYIEIITFAHTLLTLHIFWRVLVKHVMLISNVIQQSLNTAHLSVRQLTVQMELTFRSMVNFISVCEEISGARISIEFFANEIAWLLFTCTFNVVLYVTAWHHTEYGGRHYLNNHDDSNWRTNASSISITLNQYQLLSWTQSNGFLLTWTSSCRSLMHTKLQLSRLCCQKQVSRAGISNHIPQFVVRCNFLCMP